MIHIRKCHLNDESAVRDLVHGIMNREFPKESASFPTEDLKHVQSSYGGLGEAFFVAVDDAKIIGTIGIKQEDERTALLRRLFVDSRHRRKKIGSLLVDRAIEFCREVGYGEVIFKTTSAMDLAIKLCEKKGFVPKTRLDLGSVQLLKFALFLKGEAVLPQHKAVSS